MNKAKKIMLIILSIIVIIVGSIFFYVFVGENKDTDVTKKQVEEVTNNIINDIDSKLNKENNKGEQEDSTEDNDVIQHERENVQANIEVSNAKTGEAEKEVEGGIAQKQGSKIKNKEKQILEVYDSAFYELRISANKIVDGLVSSIKNDYNVLKSKNEDSLDNMMKLGASYTKRANALENQVDSSVEVVLNKMEKDMKAQNISDKKIKAYRKAYEDEYNKQKEERRASIMNKAQEMM